VADLISVPFQNNTNFRFGLLRGTQNILNIQPVAPVHLNEDWNLITRTIVPRTWQPQLTPGSGSVFGLENVNLSLFLSPAKPGEFIWGFGPVLFLPTATDEVLGSNQWGLGPSAVGLRMDGPWVYGALANKLWSFGPSNPSNKVNSFLLQPFLNYNFGDGWYLTSSPIMTANWEAQARQRWTVPVGGGIGRGD
jgi:hypothetical protein